ncbi:amidohydrolase [Halalkalibacter alkaliphilus]|uniref:Amidohydrolase n=1 Tax=Halalkalibacter alkaliphilus TaxID=2917993 RepID=A0A9X2I8B4_9BACI|nr:amidohydrolase [Halalkalibacter alkaliphilus]MCL7748120.1 amidohydrolase [Halalkalibacter alkaliphilus]
MKAFVNATILLGTGEMIKSGTILINRGKIIAVEKEVTIPAEAEIINASSKYITPGLIDVHTHLGVFSEGLGQTGHDFNETTDAATPSIRAIDGINPFDRGFEDARMAGVTTVQIMPGSANVIGGEMSIIKTKGTVVDEMVVKSPSGMKAAFGENPKRVHGGKGKLPVTRMGVAALFRQQFMKAQDYKKSLEAGEVKTRDLGMEQLMKVLNKEIPLRAHAHRADDIATLLRLVKEFDIEATIEHCTEGHLITSYIAKHNVRVSVGPTMTSRTKQELNNKGWHTLVELEKQGIPFSITTDHPVVTIDHLITSAITAVKFGLSEEAAFRAITVRAAEHLGIDQQVGSLEVGKDADIVIWNAHPLTGQAKVEKTFINGECVYNE